MKSDFSFKSVMIIDDSEMDRMLMEKMFTRNSFAETVISFDGAEEALRYLRENKTLLPQIIFLDLNMPVVDGFEFLEEFDKLPERIKNNCIVIVLSHTSNPFEIKRAEENKHVMLFLSKPITKGKLEIIASAFSGKLINNIEHLINVNIRRNYN